MTFYLDKSSIHGIGLFSKIFIPPFTPILLAFTELKNTCRVYFFAKYINHSLRPNTSLVSIHNDYYLVSTKPIYPGTEITNNYFFTPDCILKPDSSYAFTL